MSDERKELVEFLDRMLTCVTSLINELCPESERERTKKCFEQACNKIRQLIQHQPEIDDVEKYVEEKARTFRALASHFLNTKDEIWLQEHSVEFITQIVSDVRGGRIERP